MSSSWYERLSKQLMNELKLRRVQLFVGFSYKEAVFISYGEGEVGPDSVRAYKGPKRGTLQRTHAKLRSAVDRNGQASFTFITVDGEEIHCDQRGITWGDTVYHVVDWQNYCLVEGDQNTVTITKGGDHVKKLLAIAGTVAAAIAVIVLRSRRNKSDDA